MVNTHLLNDSARWRKLCRAAAVEQDADKVWQIVRKIDSALSSRQRLLRLSAKDAHERVARPPNLRPSPNYDHAA